MKSRLLNLSVYLLLCLGTLVVSAQEKAKVDEKPMDYQAIRMKLVFRSRIRESDAEISKKIAVEIRKRTVRFIIVPEEEKALRKIGANDELIDAIKNGLPEEDREHIRRLDEMSRLYLKFTDNYYKKTIPEIRIAIEAGKEFIRLYGDDPEFKEQVDYLRSTIPKLEKMIKIGIQVSY